MMDHVQHETLLTMRTLVRSEIRILGRDQMRRLITWPVIITLRKRGLFSKLCAGGAVAEAFRSSNGNVVDLWDLTKVLFRRWYITFPLVALTAVGCVAVVAYTEPDYTVTAYVQLIPPTEQRNVPPSQEIRNPWLDLGLDSLNSAAKVTTLDSAFLKSLEKGGLTESVTITEGYPNPVATIEVVGHTREQASRTADMVVARYSSIVTELQTTRGVDANSMISTLRLDTGNNIEVTNGKIKRAVIAVAGAGLLLTAGFSVGLDAMVRRRRRRKTNLDEMDAPRIPTAPTVNHARDIPSAPPPASRTAPPQEPYIPTGPGSIAPSGQRVAPRSFDVHVSRSPVRDPKVTVEYGSKVSESQEPEPTVPFAPLPPDATIILPLSPGDSRRGTETNGGSRR